MIGRILRLELLIEAYDSESNLLYYTYYTVTILGLIVVISFWCSVCKG